MELSESGSYSWQNPGASVSQEGFASTSKSSNLFRLSYDAAANGLSGPSPFAVGGAGAAWQDIVYVNNYDIANPISIRFQYEGIMSASGTSIDPITLVVANILGANNLQGENITASGGGFGNITATLQGNGTFGAKGWSSYSFDGSAFTGTYDLILYYDPILRGYDFSVFAAVTTSIGRSGSASGDFTSTFSISGVFDNQGQELTDVQFDSGLTLTVVPEPSSLILMSAGAAVLLLMRKRRVA